MVQVKFTGADRGTVEVVDGAMTIREYLTSKNAMMTASFSANGYIIPNLDIPLKGLYDSGYVPQGAVIQLFQTVKTEGAAK